jgi:hypothetical protein
VGLASSVVVFQKLFCAGTQRCRAIFSQGVVQRHLWWFFTSLSAKWFSAICGGFSQVYLCIGSVPFMWWFFTSLSAELFSAICGGFSQASLRRRTERNGPAGQV